MSTAPSPRPDDTAGTPGTTDPPALTGRSPTPAAAPAHPERELWLRRGAVGVVLGALLWCVAALLAPHGNPLRQFLAALLCAAGAVAAQHVLGVDRRLAEQARQTREHARQTQEEARQLAERARRAESTPAETAATVREVLTRHTQDITRLIESRFTQERQDAESRAQQALVSVDGSVPDLADRFAEVLAPGPSILHTFVRLEMRRVVGHLTDLTSLSAECPGENHDWMLSLTRAAEQSICATSTSVDRQFWESEPASRYLQGQQEAIEERGVPVRRVFLVESARELDDRLLRLCEEQELLGIGVRVSVLPELPPHLQRGTTNDFIVYDEAVSFEIDQDLRDVNVRTRLIARQNHVQDRMKRFRELWEAGMTLRELETRVDDEEGDTWMVDSGE
ncbi:hypothetical protein [Streptomyces mexicanus]|uniref:hypothetical protein n=1 Tax=Streptomyces mexicanus TaxID=178566 RepID=UPI0036978ED4